MNPIRTIGSRPESTFTAEGSDGKTYVVQVMRLIQVIRVATTGKDEPIANPGIEFRLLDKRRVWASQPDGEFIVEGSSLTLTAAKGSYP